MLADGTEEPFVGFAVLPDEAVGLRGDDRANDPMSLTKNPRSQSNPATCSAIRRRGCLSSAATATVVCLPRVTVWLRRRG